MSLEKRTDGWLAIDSDGTKWLCKREPFYNGAKWFVELENFESYNDVMRKVTNE